MGRHVTWLLGAGVGLAASITVFLGEPAHHYSTFISPNIVAVNGEVFMAQEIMICITSYYVKLRYLA